MPRQREFDPKKALAKAIALFWQKGYAETSMRDLVTHTGVAHAGLYSAFGGKRQLFVAALKYYQDGPMTQYLRELETLDSSRPEIEMFFQNHLQIVKDGNFQNGCFMVNTTIEFGDEARDILVIVNQHMERMIAAFSAALNRAKEREEVRADLEIQATAEYLLNTFNGVAIFARSRSPYDRIERTVKIALKVLD